GAEDDRVDLALRAVRGHDPVRSNLADRVGHDLDVRLRDRGQIVVGQEDALAAERVAWPELGAKRGVLDGALQMKARDVLRVPLQGTAEPLVEKRERRRLAEGVDARANRERRERRRAEDAPRAWPDRVVTPRQDPRRRTLEHEQAPHDRLDLGDELDG